MLHLKLWKHVKAEELEFSQELVCIGVEERDQEMDMLRIIYDRADRAKGIRLIFLRQMPL